MSGGNGGVKDDVEATGLEPAPATELEGVKKERDELKDLLLRKRAEFENFRKRTERDRAQAGQDAVFGLVQALLPALDNLGTALGAQTGDESLRKGIELIQRDVLQALEAQGVTVEDPRGKMFDPAVHEAISHEAAPGIAEGTVLDVLRKAYFLKGRLLRPALVVVAKGDEPAPDDEPEEDQVH